MKPATLRPIFFAAALAFAPVVGAPLLATPAMAVPAPESFAPIVAPLMPAVVNISTSQKVVTQTGPMFHFEGLPDTPETRQFKELFRQFQPQGQGMEREVTSLGSGFVIDPSGYVVTNNHVIANADEITVIFHDNTRLPAKIVGRDPKTDLALLQVKPAKPLVAVSFGDSDAMQVGDWVVAIGNPFGLGGSVSAGIISARGRNINAGPFDDFLQTDAAINRGNSGGPLFNTKGEVVGINSAIFSPTGGNIGIGFAIPSALAKGVLDQLRAIGHAQRAWLGVSIQEVSDEIANAIGMKKAHGALVLQTTPQSPAAKAGLLAGDVIQRFDGKEISAVHSLPRLVAESKIGARAPVVVFRKGKEITLTVILAEQADDTASLRAPTDANGHEKKTTAGAYPALLGMHVAPIDDAVRTEFGLTNAAHGLLVVDVAARGQAAKQGIRPSDIIMEVNQTALKSVEELHRILADAKKAGRAHALARVQRGKEMLFITLPVVQAASH